ncbi:MAG TPA: tetratricopeptide repeat protein, partial [Bacteroidetes bacterium]|nr:tetratricopeptide repeat protein [Bacteroidota bacterium]
MVVRIFVILLAFVIFHGVNAQSVEYYFSNGVAKHKAKDYNGAIADFSNAISINSENPTLYYCRG